MTRIKNRVFKMNRVEVSVHRRGEDSFVAHAFDGTYGVYNNPGSTPEKAKEMALLQLKKCYEEEKAPLG
jgi:hypothetical protein